MHLERPRNRMNKGRKIGIAISLSLFVIGIIWIIYNITVANPAAQKKIACLDEKSKLLDEKMAALDRGDTAQADQLQLQVDNIHC